MPLESEKLTKIQELFCCIIKIFFRMPLRRIFTNFNLQFDEIEEVSDDRSCAARLLKTQQCCHGNLQRRTKVKKSISFLIYAFEIKIPATPLEVKLLLELKFILAFKSSMAPALTLFTRRFVRLDQVIPPLNFPS